MRLNKVKVKGDNNLVAINSSFICLNPQEKIQISKNFETRNVFTNKMMHVFDLINKYLVCEEDINFYFLGSILGLDSNNYINEILESKKEPSYEFLELVADKLCLSIDWLKYSHGNPFDCKPIMVRDYEDIYNYCKNNPIQNIIILHSNEIQENVMILVSLSPYQYRRFSITYPMHSSVGAGGGSMIYDFYKLARKINSDRDLYINTWSYVVSEEIFYAIRLGKYFPGCYQREKLHNTYFWEDIFDLDNYYFSVEEYEKMYGADFKKIQDIIRYKKSLSENGSN